jgi:threonine aldolase
VLLGPSAFIKKARRIRKVFGGGMRQAGFIAAAGIYALEHHVERLKEDHQHTALIAKALSAKNEVAEVLPIETNIIIFHLKPGLSAKEWVAKMKEHDILGYAIAPTSVRLVLHLDITPSMVQKTIDVIHSMK